MKKYLLITACVLSVHLAEAYSNASLLHLRLYDNAPFTVAFDNQEYTTPSNNYQLTNIVPGTHFLRVTKMMQYGQGWNSYYIPLMVYQGWVTVPTASNMDALVNPNNQLTMLSVAPIYTGPDYSNPWGYDPYGCGNGNGGGGCGNNGNGYGNNGYGNGYGNNGYGNGNTNNGYTGYNYGIPVADFEALKTSIKNKSFDDTRLTVAKQGIRYGITAAQVSELVRLMTFESTKLDLAKYAYSYTIDKNNYHLVSNAFTYESSTTELAQYISTH